MGHRARRWDIKPDMPQSDQTNRCRKGNLGKESSMAPRSEDDTEAGDILEAEGK